jgi:nucleoside-diphosphate-sugar epimerase
MDIFPPKSCSVSVSTFKSSLPDNPNLNPPAPTDNRDTILIASMSTALVTGGTGFIATYVVKLLLERGGSVHTTVRRLDDRTKCQPLLELQTEFPGKLEIFQADLLKDGSFNKAMQGCELVYHVASPFLVPAQIKDGMKDCVEPALKGTRTVLESANRSESVKRVVLTSSSTWTAIHSGHVISG